MSHFFPVGQKNPESIMYACFVGKSLIRATEIALGILAITGQISCGATCWSLMGLSSVAITLTFVQARMELMTLSEGEGVVVASGALNIAYDVSLVALGMLGTQMLLSPYTVNCVLVATALPLLAAQVGYTLAEVLHEEFK